MKDPITTAYVIKGALSYKKFGKFVQAVGQVEIEAMQYLIEVADILETQYEKRNSDNFDHVVFAYEVAEPFGEMIAKIVAKGGHIVSSPGVETLADRFLSKVEEPALSEDARRIQNDKLTDSSEALESSYFGIDLNEHPMFPIADWRFEVANGDTRDGYWSWVYNCVHNWEESK